MIGNQTKGRGFRGLLNYLESQKDAKLIGGNMGGNNARALAREFKISRQLNLEADRVVYHASLSLPENEQLDELTWNELANRYLEEMGFDSNQYVVYRHSNTQHDHIHICASRIRLDNGKIVHDSWDYKRSEIIIRQLERDYGLQQTQSSHEKLSRNPSIGQQKRLEREQEEYINGERLTPQERPIKQQLQELIDRATQDKPTMPLLVERLQLQGVEVRHGLTRNGKSKGISYSWNDQKFSGTSLGPAYTFPGLQKHKGIDYQPQRDDELIENLLKNPKEQAVESQRFINIIADFIEQSVVDDALAETLPQLTEQLSAYQQQLANNKTTFDDLETAIVDEEQQLSSPKAVDAISNFIEQSVVDDSLVETLPQLTEQLSAYQQQLEAGKTAFDDLGATIVNEEQRLSSQRAVDAISDFIEQSVVDDALAETLPQLTEQLSIYRQQLFRAKTAFNDFETALTTELQSHAEKKAILSISDYIEQSAIESALTETVLGLTEQLSQYRQQLLGAKTTFNDFDEAFTAELQSHADQKAILSIFDYIEQSTIESALSQAVLGLTQQVSQYHQQLLEAKTTFNDFETALTAELQSHAEKRAILSISDYIEQSTVESALTETILELTQKLSQYKEGLVTAKATFNDLDAELAAELQSYLEKRAISSISDYIEQSAVESALTEAVLELTQQLSQYKEQLVTAKATFKDLDTVLATELQSHVEKRAISSISDYVEQSTVESALTEAVLELTQQLSQNQQQLEAGRTIFDDLEAAIVYLEKLHRLQKPVDAIALNQTPTITTDEPKLKDNLRAELYEYYSADLQNLLVTDRDKEIAKRALLDNKPSEEVEEIIFASPAGWTTDEARELVLIANNQLAHLQEQPQFTPPPEDESLRPVLQYYLTQQRALTNLLVQPLQRQGLAYIDQQENVVFIKRDLNGEKSGALVWDTARLDNRAFKYPDSDRSEGWFHLKLGGEADDKIERVFLCDSPIDALTMAEIDRNEHKGQPPVRTMYMAVDDPNNLPVEFLRNISRIGAAFNNDDRGNQAAQVVQEKLPQAKRIAPSRLTWNEILIEQQQQQQQEELEQRSRGLSR
ncbi:relaxase/mobilization nuclease domain-containing protein [Nostoc sp. LEGE 12450]|uniref:relaxase/mobilization nuclease domain-containing protein n=1 Tax=Nostoc sp. LEGE 12450 TaxID=1828643 RepID=UPI001882C372|nr:relaxase/mobilization nuclease domain-containing protein [Nostoc sp. LEGE 12450]MBE8989102.1 relaxase/mobilization nuclease domain-containing protein [Nostoc sp. LEGE 12450]